MKPNSFWACCACKLVCWVAAALLAVTPARAALFECQAASGSASAEARVYFVVNQNIDEVDWDGDATPLSGCQGGVVTAEAAAAYDGTVGTGNATFSLAITADGIEMSAQQSGTSSRNDLGLGGDDGFYGGGGGRGSGRVELRVLQPVIATVRLTDDTGDGDFSIGVISERPPRLPINTPGTWVFPICPDNGTPVPVSVSASAPAFRLSITFAPAGPNTCLQAGLRALEVTQSIQDWSNSIPLIAKKGTYVRAHLQALDSASVGKSVSARLRGFRNGSELPDSPQSAIAEFPFNDPAELVADAVAQRYASAITASKSTLNFVLPESWRSGTIRLLLDSPEVVIEPMESAGPRGLMADGSVTVSFQAVPRPTVVYSAIRVIGANGVRGPYPSLEDISSALLATKSMYPVDGFTHRTGNLLYVDLRSSTPLEVQLNSVMALRRFGTGPLGNAFGIGLLSASQFPTGSVVLGEAQSALSVAWATIDSRDTLPHELGHLLGRTHTAHIDFLRTNSGGIFYKRGSCCEVAVSSAPDFPYYYPIQDVTGNYGCGVTTTLRPTLGPLHLGENAKMFGFERLQNLYNFPANPSNTFELMSYCGTAPKWPSAETYVLALEAITNRFGTSPSPAPLAIAEVFSPRLIVRGLVNFTTEQIEWLPFQCFSDVADLVPSPAGEYQVRLLDAANALLGETSFQALLPDDFESSTGDWRAPFVVALPFNEAATRVEIVRGGIVQATANASPNAPLIQLLAPNGGETLDSGEFDVRWQAADADEDGLSFTLEYSADDGASWNTIGTDLPGNNLVVDVSGLRGSSAARFRVLASDGFRCEMDESDAPFAVADKGPAVLLLQPGDGARFYARQSLQFEGLALDLEDGELEPATMEWRSDVQGLLGTGAEVFLKANQLAEGAHRVSLTARDSNGGTTSVTNRIFIHRAAPPRLRLADVQGGTAVLEISGTVPSRTVLETSTNLFDWTPSQTFTQAYQVELRADALPSPPAARFFRARAESLPLPVGAPEVALQPLAASALLGGGVHLSIVADGELPLSYQWLYNGAVIANATNSRLQLTNLQLSDAGAYALSISNEAGVTVSSNIALTVVARAFETLHQFGPALQAGINGWGTLAAASDGKLYGCIRNGGLSNAGAIFRLERTGSNYTVLHHFTGGAGGVNPLGGIVEGSDGLLYGTTSLGGTNSSGVIFRIDRDGSAFTILHHFRSTGDCRNPQAELLEASDGALYGTAYSGGGFGRGGVFRINKDGTAYAIVSGFNFGGTEAPRQPIGGLVEGLDGFLYGTTELGGATTNGTIFKLSKDGATAAVLKSLGLVAGGAKEPNGTLVFGEDGQLYGTAAFGGTDDFGAIFRIATNGTDFAVIESFSVTEAREPRAGLIRTRGGSLVGTSRIGGGEAGAGALFKISPGADFPYIRLYDFTGLQGNGARLRGPVVHGNDGFLYGTTFGGGTSDQGTVFRYWLGD